MGHGVPRPRRGCAAARGHVGRHGGSATAVGASHRSQPGQHRRRGRPRCGGRATAASTGKMATDSSRVAAAAPGATAAAAARDGGSAAAAAGGAAAASQQQLKARRSRRHGRIVIAMESMTIVGIDMGSLAMEGIAMDSTAMVSRAMASLVTKA